MGVLRSLGKGLFYLFLIAFAFFGYRFAVFMFVPINLRLDLLNSSTEPTKYDIESMSVLTDVRDFVPFLFKIIIADFHPEIILISCLQQFVKTSDGINLHVWTGGKPDPTNVLIFLHGFPESG